MDAEFSFNNEGNVRDRDTSKRITHQLSDYLKSDKDNDKENIKQKNGIPFFLYNKDENNTTHEKEEKKYNSNKKETIENNFDEDKYTLFVEKEETDADDENNYGITIATIIKNKNIDFIKIKAHI